MSLALRIATFLAIIAGETDAIPMLYLLEQAYQNLDKVAIREESGSFTYRQVLQKAEQLATELLGQKEHLQAERICYLTRPGMDTLVSLWGIWLAGGIAVPMGLMYPIAELAYVLELSQATALLVSDEYEDKGQQAIDSRKVWLHALPKTHTKQKNTQLPAIDPNQGALMLFTSGTTSRPKGVLHSHSNLQAQVQSLQKAWKWSIEDHILCVLPLHHTHGLINVLSCSLASGASCTFLPKFEAKAVWEHFASGALSLFMAVPTVYKKLVDEWEQQELSEQKRLSAACEGFRLMVSGSAALPVSLLEKWESITGQRLLERYGMTEIGMCLSNPYEGERRAGTVGQPLPGVEVRLLDENLKEVAEGQQGQIVTRGPAVFHEYFRNEKASQEAFTDDGWFLTGDMAKVEDGYIRILGRSSVDILKSGGYKISALEIEEVIRSFAGVIDCAVVGLEDEEWGQRIAAALVVGNEEAFDREKLRAFLLLALAPYKVPRDYRLLDDLPRNALGKVQKKAVQKLFEATV